MKKAILIATISCILAFKPIFSLSCEVSQECREKITKDHTYTYTCATSQGDSGICAQPTPTGAIFCCSQEVKKSLWEKLIDKISKR